MYFLSEGTVASVPQRTKVVEPRMTERLSERKQKVLNVLFE